MSAARAVGPAARVLVVSARAEERARIGGLLGDRGYEVDCCASVAEALDALGEAAAAVLLVDAELLDGSGDTLLHELEARGLKPPLVVTVPRMGVSRAVEAVRRGAIEIVERPIDGSRLAGAIARALASRPPESGAPSRP